MREGVLMRVIKAIALQVAVLFLAFLAGNMLAHGNRAVLFVSILAITASVKSMNMMLEQMIIEKENM